MNRGCEVMTDKEIIKALRCCAGGDCGGCAYVFRCDCRVTILNAAADRLEELTASQHVMKMREDA